MTLINRIQYKLKLLKPNITLQRKKSKRKNTKSGLVHLKIQDLITNTLKLQ